ncbi:hypothetical protein [Legionella sp. WA2022007384]
MLLFKSVLNGVGSGAGVAWPLFGIVFAILGGSIANFFSLALGVISISLFFGIGGSIFYFSYQEMQANEQLFQEQLQKNQQKLLTDIHEYIEIIRRYCSYTQNSECFNDAFIRILNMDLDKIRHVDAYSPLYQILSLLKNEYAAKQNIPNNTIILKHLAYAVSLQPVPVSKRTIPAFFTFVGTFGSIAGCSAGVSGVLTGMGIFSSFASFPLLGWGVLAFALCSGITLAYEAFIRARDDFNNKLLILTFKSMHQQLSKVTMARNLSVSFSDVFRTLGTQSEQKDKTAFVDQPHFTRLYLKQLYKEQSKLPFLSFFNRSQLDPLDIPHYSSSHSSSL